MTDKVSLVFIVFHVKGYSFDFPENQAYEIIVLNYKMYSQRTHL